MFLEGWRALNDYFYDPEFHGVDWTAMRDKYLPAVESGIPARDDFDDLVSLMLGELNASHLGISAPRGGKRSCTGRRAGSPAGRVLRRSWFQDCPGAEARTGRP